MGEATSPRSIPISLRAYLHSMGELNPLDSDNLIESWLYGLSGFLSGDRAPSIAAWFSGYTGMISIAISTSVGANAEHQAIFFPLAFTSS